MLDEATGEARPTEEKSIGDLFGDLARELGTLVRQEIQLAQVEMSDIVAAAYGGVLWLTRRNVAATRSSPGLV